MVIGAVTVFFASLAGIVGLFSLKLIEERNAQSYVSSLRTLMDALAIQCKRLLLESEEFMARLPSLSAYMALKGLAASAVSFSRLAKTAAESAHRLADFVSHKHNFERKETRSDFLKQVGEYAIRNQTPTPASPAPRKFIRDIDVRT